MTPRQCLLFGKCAPRARVLKIVVAAQPPMFTCLWLGSEKEGAWTPHHRLAQVFDFSEATEIANRHNAHAVRVDERSDYGEAAA